MGFSRRTLEANQDIIKQVMEAVLGLIEEETELIGQDSLARGKLISSVSTSVQITEGQRWGFADYSSLASGFKEEDPPEWWGEINLYSSNFVSATNTFPWAPTAISEAQYF